MNCLRTRPKRECNRRRAEHGAQQDLPLAPAISRPSLKAVIAEIERERLFRILEDLVRWENTTVDAVLALARAEIRQSWRRACADNAGHPRAEMRFNPDRLRFSQPLRRRRDPRSGHGGPLQRRVLSRNRHPESA